MPSLAVHLTRVVSREVAEVFEHLVASNAMDAERIGVAILPNLHEEFMVGDVKILRATIRPQYFGSHAASVLFFVRGAVCLRDSRRARTKSSAGSGVPWVAALIPRPLLAHNTQLPVAQLITLRLVIRAGVGAVNT